jgi:type IV pilus assembly protein PilY1
MHNNYQPLDNGCRRLKAALLLTLLATSPAALSDDVEVYLQEPPTPVPPNILFVLDESGSMDNPGVNPNLTRMQELQNALSAIVADPDMGNVNTALLGYTTSGSHYWHRGVHVSYARSGNFKPIEGNLDSFLSQIENLQTINFTTTTSALIDAVNWFRPDVNFTDSNGIALDSPFSNASSEEMQCASNHIVLLSDGRPNTDQMTSWNAIDCAVVDIFGEEENNRAARCSREVARWANETDLMTGSGWEGDQNITVSTIGFYTNDVTSQYLASIATDDGEFYASSGTTIVSDLTAIINNAQQNIDYTYNAPSIPFNSDNAAISGEDIYIPFLVPDTTLFWKGNLKKYNVSVTDDEIVITDDFGNRILNNDNQFRNSKDEWASGHDGGDVLVGGAAENMSVDDGNNRTLFTNVDGSGNLSSETNRVHDENELITMAMLGVGSEEDRTSLLDWISWDSNVPPDESHEGEMGAPIHTQPVVVEYGGHSTVYIPTSEGVLEAFDAATGEELWAFMPQDLLNNISRLKANDSATIPYYGLDGPLTVYEANETKMAIVGMRRGGNAYYLLNISDRLEPQLVSIISGDDENGGFNKLGQTWSKPMFVKMDIDGNTRDVLVFGGGYDADQDDETSRTADDVGNVIYIVDALTGSLIRSISNSDASVNVSGMSNSIPADVMTIDLNGDARVDRIYAADVGGRIIRVDVAAMTGGVITDINEGSGQFRRFFNAPQIGYFSKGGRTFLTILIGSGNRTAPLSSDVIDRFYMIMDTAVWAAPTDYETVTESDLVNASTVAVDLTNPSNAGRKGWYIDFSASEKSYSKAILYDYLVFFTTYSAEAIPSDDVCEATGAEGTARLYGVELLTANAMIDWDSGHRSDTPLSVDHRSMIMTMTGIPPTPLLVFPGTTNANGETVLGRKIYLFSDLEKKAGWSDRLRPIYWEEVIPD